MKLTNKLAGILLALAMVLGIAATAFAEGETGSITIYDAAVGQTYTIYQILDLESYNNKAGAYAYKATTAWNTFINSGAIKGIYVEVDAQGYVTWKDGADAAAFAKAAQKYAKDNSTEMFVQSLFPDKFKDIVTQCFLDNNDSFSKLFNDPDFYNKVQEAMAAELYKALRKD